MKEVNRLIQICKFIIIVLFFKIKKCISNDFQIIIIDVNFLNKNKKIESLFSKDILCLMIIMFHLCILFSIIYSIYYK